MSTFWDTSPLTVEGVAITNPRAGGGSEGMISARAALGGSQNVAAFRAAEEAGVDNVIAMAKAVGITTLDQHFDPTFLNHEGTTYGASIATGGANIRAIDMAYAFSVFANMGTMVGVPTYAQTIEMDELKDVTNFSGLDLDRAREQKLAFSRGHLRLPGSRALDPVTVLKVEDRDGNVLYDHLAAGDLQRVEVVNPGSAWLVHSIISDCNSRFIIWGCGESNDDLRLDFILDGQRAPSGAKTGTQQGPLSAVDTLETWMNGYSRHAATALWVGNANNELVNDGPAANYAAANTTVRLYKNWMAAYHVYLQGLGQISAPLGFDELQPDNVAEVGFPTVATDRGLGGGCDQRVTGWIRTDVTYEDECHEVEIDTRNGLLAGPDTPAQFRKMEKFVKPPPYHPENIREHARRFKIPLAPVDVSQGQVPVSIISPKNGDLVRGRRPVVVTIDVPGLESWTLEIGQGSNPAEWSSFGSGTSNVVDYIAGWIEAETIPPGVWTVRITAESDATSTALEARITINTQQGSGSPFDTPTTQPLPGGQLPGRTPTPSGR
jgi:membrane peptidoglycan carboxypeptidase